MTDQEELREIMGQFCDVILDKIVNEPAPSATCSGWDTKRSAYTQLQQLYLVADEDSDDVIMDQIFPLSVPCLSGSCTPCGKVWYPKKFKYLLSRTSLNSWAPQNHMDCAAAAAAGAINAALGIPRGSPAFVTVQDVVSIMKLDVQQRISETLKDYQKKHKDHDLSPLQNALKELLGTDSQVAKEGEDIRTKNISISMMHDRLLNRVGRIYASIVSQYNGFMANLYFLKNMRSLEVHAGYVPLDDTINCSGLPVHAQLISGYEWNDLKSWLADPTIGVVAYIPSHAVMIFGVGESKKGKYRHALIGRASGGQTPSSWIPFEEKDIHPDETFWSHSHGIGNKPGGPLFLTCRTKGRSSHVALVVKKKDHGVYIPHTNFEHFHPPDWLKSTEFICNTCVLHVDENDTVNHPIRRKEWIKGTK